MTESTSAGDLLPQRRSPPEGWRVVAAEDRRLMLILSSGCDGGPSDTGALQNDSYAGCSGVFAGRITLRDHGEAASSAATAVLISRPMRRCSGRGRPAGWRCRSPTS